MANEKKIIEIDIQLLDGLQNIEKLQTEIKKLNDANKELDRSNKNQAKQYAENTVLIRDYNKQLNVLIKETANAAKVSGQTMGYMQQLKAEVSNLTLQYERLSKAELEDAKVGGVLLNSLKTKREELAKLQQAYGNYSLQVGDYSKATNGLRLSVGMLAGELPNAGISMRTFVMSLSNNIQGLAQAITQARNENALLKKQFAEGIITEKPISLFKQLTSAIFSWQTLLMVGVALIVAYSDKIFKLGENTSNSIKKITNAEMQLNTVIQTLNKTMKDGGGVYAEAISDIEKMTISLKASKGSKELAKKALDDYNESLGVTFGKAKDVDSALKLIKSNENDYVLAMQKMAFANAFFNQSAEDMTKIVKTATASNAEILGSSSNTYIKNIEKAEKRLKEGASEWVNTWNSAGQKTLQLVSISRNRLEIELNQAVSAYNNATKVERERQIAEIQKNQNISLKQAEKYYNEYAALFKKNGWTFKENENDKNNKTKESFDYEGELRELTVKQETDDYKKRLAEIEKYYGDKKDIYEKALKEETLTKEQYDNLMLELGVAVQKQQIDAYDDYLKKISKTAQDAIDKANSDWNKFRNNQKENILIISKTELQKQQQDYNLAVFKNTDDLNNAKKLRQAEYWTDIAELDKQNLDKNSKEYQLAKKSIDDKYYLIGLQDEKYYLDKKTELYFNYANTVSGILNNVSDFVAALSERELQSYAKTIQGKVNYDELYARKKAEIERKNAVLNRSVASFGTIVNTAEAIMKAMTTDPTGVLAVLTGIQGAIQLATIWAQPLPSYEGSSGSQSKSTTQVTEKFHTGTYRPSSSSEEQEITRTLLTSERILSPTQTSIFDSMINKVQSYGGSGSITNGVGVNDYLQESMLVRAFSKALVNQKPQQISITEFSNQVQRQQQLQNNLFVR